MEELKVQNSLLLQLVRGLQQQINSKNRQNQILFQQYDQLTNDYQHLQKTVDTLRAQNSQFKRQNIPNHENHSKLSYYQQQLAQAKQKSGQYEQIIITLRRQLQQKGGTIVFLQNQLKKPKEIEQNISEVESLQPKIDELSSMLEMKEKSLTDLTEYMNIQAEKISELTREGITAIENYEAKIEEKQNIIKELNEDMKKLKQSIKVLQQIKAEIKQVPSLNNETTSYLQKIQELNAQLQYKTQSIEELSQFMQTQAEKISKYQLQNSPQEAENRKNHIENLQAIIKNKEQANSQLNQFLESILARSREMQEKLVQFPSIKEENETLKAEINALKPLQQIKIEEQNLSQNKKEIQQEQGNHQIDILRAKLSTKQDEILHLKQIIEDREMQLTSLRVELDEKVLKVTEMQSLSQQNQVEFPSDNANEGQEYKFKTSQKTIAKVKQMEQVMLELQSIKTMLQERQQYIETLQKNNQDSKQNLQIQAIDQYLEKQNQVVEKSQQTDIYIESLEKKLEQLTLKLAQYQIKPTVQSYEGKEKDENYVEQQNKEISNLQQQIVELQAIIQSKSQTIAELSEFMNQQSQELESLREKVDQSGEKENSNNEAAEKEKQIVDLQEILKSKQSSIAELGQFLQEAYSKISTLQEEKKAFQKPIQFNEQENVQVPNQEVSDKVKDELNELLRQKNESLQENKRFRSEILQKEQKIAQLTSKIEQQNQQISEIFDVNPNEQVQILKSKIKDLQETIISKDQIISDFSQFMDDQATKITELQGKIGQNNGQNNAQLDKKQDKNENQEKQYEQIKSILKTKQQSVNQLTEFLQESYTKNAALQQTIESLKQEINELNSKLNEQSSPGVQQFQNIEESGNSLRINEGEGEVQKILANNEELMQMTQKLKQAEQQIERRITDIAKITAQLQLLEEKMKQSQQISEKLAFQISALQENKKNLKSQCEHLQNIKAQFTQSLSTMSQVFQKYTKTINENNQKQSSQIPNESNDNDGKIIDLQKKLQQYQQQINQKQEQLGSMMEVLQTLQNEIRNKDDIIEQLQSMKQTAPTEDREQQAEKDLIIKQLQQQIYNFKSSLEAQQNKQGNPLQLQKQYQNLGFQYQNLQSTSKQFQHQYQNELKEMNSENALQRQLGQLTQTGQFNREMGQIETEQELTLLQAIQQIILYSENQGSNQRIFGYIEAIKGAYQKQTEVFQTQIQQLSETLSSLVEANKTLAEQLQNQTIQSQQAKKELQDKEGQFTELAQKCQQLQLDHLQQIKNMRRSASTLKDQISSKPQDNRIIIQKLQDEIIALKTDNIKKQSELQQLREHKNKKFVKELNNLLDSYTGNKEGQEEREIKDVEEELEKIALERDQLKRRCFSYQGQIADLQKHYSQLSNQFENVQRNNIKDPTPVHEQIQNSAHIDSLHLNDPEGKLLNGLEQPLKLNGIGGGEQSHSCTDEQGTERLRIAYEQLYVRLNQKNAAILQLQETMIKVEKGYNNEIMNLRKIIAELNNDSILLRKNLYQANPDAIDIGELIKDTFSSSQKDTQFYKPNLPLYSQSLLNIQQNHNNSYYSEAYRGGQRPKRRYEPYYHALNMGQRFMGRRCKQENPFNAHLQLEESRFKGHHSSIKYDRRY